MKLLKNKKLAAIMALTLCATIVAAGSFAWITSSDKHLNRFETASNFSGDLSLSEIFDPPTDWMPGQTVPKNVSVINTGNTTMNIRVSFEEILNKIISNGGAPFTTNDFSTLNYGTGSRAGGDLDLNGDVPVTVDVTNFLTGTNGWYTPANINYDAGVSPLPSGAVVVVTQSGSSFGAKAWIPVTYNGAMVNQLINLGEFVMSESVSGGGYDTILIKGTGGEITYPFYKGYSTAEASWAGTNHYTSSGTGPDKPATANTGKAVTDNKILLEYVAANLNNTTPEAGKWFYNPADGYFYFCGAVAPGGATNSLLDGVKLDGSADANYSGMFFDLGVIAEGIQSTEEALRAADGWNLSDATLIAALLA